MSKEMARTHEDITVLMQRLLKQIQDEEIHQEKAKQDFIKETIEFNIIKDKMSKICTNCNYKIKLNIGGKIFTTTLETLTGEKDNFFSAMFSEQFNTKPDEDGEYFIDRDPKLFPYILNYLRNSTEPEWDLLIEKHLFNRFQEEIDFYQIKSLKRSLEKTEKSVGDKVPILEI